MSRLKVQVLRGPLFSIMGSYQPIEHTADIGVRVKAQTLPDLFNTCASALINIVFDSKPLAIEQEIKLRKIKLSEATIEDLLVRWLNELLSLLYTYKFCPIDCSVSISCDKDSFKLFCDASFIEIDLSAINKEVKAATYHGLKVEEINKECVAEIIFDV